MGKYPGVVKGIKFVGFLAIETTCDVWASLSKSILQYISDYSTTVNHIHHIHHIPFSLIKSVLSGQRR